MSAVGDLAAWLLQHVSELKGAKQRSVEAVRQHPNTHPNKLLGDAEAEELVSLPELLLRFLRAADIYEEWLIYEEWCCQLPDTEVETGAPMDDSTSASRWQRKSEDVLKGLIKNTRANCVSFKAFGVST